MIYIDTNLYDRQIRTYGEEAVKMIASSSVTIIGLESGLGTEIGKNLALGGIKNIYLFDNELINKDNIETGFYYTRDDIGKIRSHVLKNKLQELNQYVSIHVIEHIDSISTSSILIFVNQTLDQIRHITNNKERMKMIVVFCKGVAGTVFVDASINHLITDVNGENIEPVQIGSIEGNKVYCAQNNSHDYQTNDYIKFINLEGKNLEVFNKEFQIEVVSPTCFKLKDFDNNDFEFTNGTSIYIKKPITVSHLSFEEQLINPTFNFSFDDSELIFKTMIKYFDKNEIDNSLGETFSAELMPVISLIGSVTASETIKLITHKYIPINQIWCWYDPKLIPKSRPLEIGESALGKLYGKDFEDSIKSSSWFLVGSGAIGCELLKNLAILNVSSNENGKIYLTDPDNIEKSNLNRQFLFRNEHIGKPKSQMATDVIKKMNPNINIIALTEKVSKNNQNFTDDIMSKVDGVLNALDNVEARKYMDEQCYNNQLPLFESGTTGTKGNTQPIIPFLTETYSNSADPPQAKSFPICTIKNFPNEIQHTIHWAMDNFELFNRAPLNINKWIKNNNVFTDDNLIANLQGKEDVMNFLIKMNIKSFEDCVHSAIDMFHNNFKNQITQLLTVYPQNHMIDDKLFWSNGKRMPTPIELDLDNNDHFYFIEATARIIARCYNLNDNCDNIKIIAKNYRYINDFTVDLNAKIASKDSEISNVNTNKISLPDNKEYQNYNLISQEFEKDDLIIMDWVTATSNLRAINYSIPISNKQETKGIAGRIIPAIATTTSVVAGLIILEMIKYMLVKKNLLENKVETYRSTFVNLADTTLVYSDPIETKDIIIGGVKFNGWSKFKYTKDTNLYDFKKEWENTFKTTISMIVYDNSLMFADFTMDENECKDIIISEYIKNKNPSVDLNKISIINIASSDDINLPEIHFNLLLEK